VFAKGKMMLKKKEPLVVGYFEKGYAKISVDSVHSVHPVH
jgi:hypothetical protein